ncbi:MAG: NADH-quinone oxidoreductase subunit A [Bacteroidetes bacterium]|nr:NADH-quinone oxidoreductase subunit A [Bacteroidota bacterium]
MLTEFGKIFIFILVAILFVLIAFVMAKLVRPSRPTYEKSTIYECGEEPIGSPWVQFNIRFYVVALIFLIFDVEIVLLFPWALSYQDYGFYGFAVGIIFLVVLGIGMAYEWRKGDLEWARPKIQVPVLNNLIKRSEVKSES